MVSGLGNGCSAPEPSKQSADGAVDNLRCAAMISAADKLMVSDAVARDPTLSQHGLLAMMSHLNAYAIPKRLPEKEGFAAVESERERILASLEPAEIVAQARNCVEQIRLP